MKKISCKAWVAALLMTVGVFAVALQVKAACNAANGTQVTLTLIGPQYVQAGGLCTFSLVSSTSGVDMSGGTWTWSYEDAGFTLAPPIPDPVTGEPISPAEGSIVLVAPTTASTSLSDTKTISCEFSKTGWMSTDPDLCEDEIQVTVLKIDFVEASANSGFDETVAPNWLIVPINNSPNQNTANVTIEPSDATTKIYFTVDSATAGTATVSPSQATTSPQTITVTGASEGHSALRARVGSAMGPIIETLNICIRDKMTVSVDFHYMQDNAGQCRTMQVTRRQGQQVLRMDLSHL